MTSNELTRAAVFSISSAEAIRTPNQKRERSRRYTATGRMQVRFFARCGKIFALSVYPSSVRLDRHGTMNGMSLTKQEAIRVLEASRFSKVSDGWMHPDGCYVTDALVSDPAAFSRWIEWRMTYDPDPPGGEA